MRLRTCLLPAAALVASCTFDAGGLAVSPGGDDGGSPRAPDARPGDPVDARVVADAAFAPDAEPPDAEPSGCPLDYVPSFITGTSYRVVSDTKSWPDAEADCEDDGFGTHLAIISDDVELGAVDFVVPFSDTWVGMTDRVQEGSWRWVDGDPASFQPWGQGEPNNSGNEDCAELNGNTMNDDKCTATKNPFVCECDGIPADPASYQSTN